MHRYFTCKDCGRCGFLALKHENFFWGPLEPFRENLPLYSTVFVVLYQNMYCKLDTDDLYQISCYMYHDTNPFIVHASLLRTYMYCTCTHAYHMQQCEWDDHLLVSGSVVVWDWPTELGLGALSILTIVCTALQTHWLDTVIIQIWLTRATIIAQIIWLVLVGWSVKSTCAYMQILFLHCTRTYLLIMSHYLFMQVWLLLLWSSISSDSRKLDLSQCLWWWVQLYT